MIRTALAVCSLFLVSGLARADAAPAAGAAPDMSKMGPSSRKPTNEKETKKEIADFYKQLDEIHKTGDFDKMISMVDFPVYMVTDDSKGVPSAMTVDKEAYVAMMKPFWDHMPKDSKMTHKTTVAVLSDSLVSVVDDSVMTAGKMKMAGRDHSLLVKRDGQWKWKVMTEAGWGDMKPPAAPSAAAQPAAGAQPTTASTAQPK